MDEITEPTFYSTNQAAEVVGVTDKTLRLWMRKGLCRPTIMIGKNTAGWSLADILRLRKIRKWDPATREMFAA